ncbi:MAG TPA: prepilin-type N-terminal cleavage/methylation domain-containing protein [Candidatus Hydrogenedentes bacterium]|nr:prepilin-type N-terminal cleavage/methylation domain-containing protein [Candidatus Hydrogenedentota bacterium]HNT88521.1 prepilin-type N-terminal cleavage/methylation domain-containing protein [Candidatus Hydrogenedentota bacterium]
MRNRGMTLIEVMFATAIFTVVMGTVFGLALSFGETATVQNAKATAHDEARRALLVLIPDLHQAARLSVNWAELPGERLSYRVATDLDGNGTAVDVNGNIELTSPRVVSRDLEDLNGDGLTAGQLIVVSGGAMRVLANDVSPESEQPNAEGVFGDAEDTNGNGRMDRGIWFEPWGRGLRVTIQTQGLDRRGRPIRATLQEIVFPRN